MADDANTEDQIAEKGAMTDFSKMLEEIRLQVEISGLTEKDVEDAIKKVRSENKARLS